MEYGTRAALIKLQKLLSPITNPAGIDCIRESDRGMHLAVRGQPVGDRRLLRVRWDTTEPDDAPLTFIGYAFDDAAEQVATEVWRTQSTKEAARRCLERFPETQPAGEPRSLT